MADLYRKSSQFRLWSFSMEELYQMKINVNSKYANMPDALTVQEEDQLVLFFASDRMEPFCEYFRLPSQIRATAVAYFRRFYLKNSVMDYDPKLLLPTCVFLAAKSENFFIPIQQFAEALSGIDQKQVLDLEFTLFQALEFTLVVHTALKPLMGFFLDMQSLGDFDVKELGSLHDKSRSMIVNSLGNDAMFLYAPSHIALAALMECNEVITTQYMVHTMDGPNKSLDNLLAIVENCREQLRLGTQVVLGRDELKAVSKRLKRFLQSKESDNSDDRTGGGPDPKRRRINE